MGNNEIKTKESKFWFLKYCGYGSGAIGLDLSYGLFYSFLNTYLTNVLKLSSKFLLILTPLARIWDGINDPMMGTLVDMKMFKKNKYKPWISIGALCNAVVVILLFNNIFKLSGASLMVYSGIMYVLWGMTNTLADIPYWSMIPSFTSDPAKRSIISTIARAFSGLGQGIVMIGAPLVVNLVSNTIDPKTQNKTYDAVTFNYLSVIVAIGLILFSTLCVTTVKERYTTKPKEKLSFGKSVKTAVNNDQLLIFMLFAMLSNAGFYMVSGVGAYYFDVVVGNTGKQSMFNVFGAAGSVIGLLLVPIMLKVTSRRRAYQFSLLLAMIGYAGEFASQKFIPGVGTGLMIMNISNFISQVGTGSMFVSQTVFLADIVDYGEIKMGYRAESVTFSMKGFLQKMAYTLQTIILYASLSISHYDGDLHYNNTPMAKNAISVMMLVLPFVLMLLSLLVFTFKFKLYGKKMEDITAQVMERREKEAAIAEEKSKKEKTADA